ncbi:MAG: trypsin-like peptidase domain-containing protein [Acidobacteriota bacterium]
MRRPGRVFLWLMLAVPGALLWGADAIPVVHTGPSVFHSVSARPAAASPPLDVAAAASRLPETARHALPPLSRAERALLASPDARGPLRKKRPALRVGVVRPLPAEVGFRGLPADLSAGACAPWGGGSLERAAAGGWTWTASFSTDGAQAMRLHVREAWLPPGSRVDVFDADGEAYGPYTFESATRPEGFWTNTVFSSQALLRVQLPAADASRLSDARLFIAAVVHMEPSALAAGGKTAAGILTPQSQTCFVDATCVSAAEFPNLDLASRAVGQLNFVDTDGAFVCTGGLLSTTPASPVPYLLTANHCFSSQASATSLEAIWNYTTASCGAPEPNPRTFPSTLGSTLLATGETSDFTLVRLSQDPPDGSVFLGWTTADVSHAGGTLIHRLSHPDGRPQFYSRHEIEALADPLCSGVPQGNYIYSTDVRGGTGGGSSGSPAYLEDLEVVGQELGGCGTNTEDDCDAVHNSTVDGAFWVTFPSVQAWLAPVSPAPCVGSPTTLCLNGGRFRVTAAWARASGDSGSGSGIALTDDSGYFWFFDPSNIELVVKVLNACPGFSRFWVFAGGLTNVFVRLTVEDTVTGAVQIYDNPQGTAYVALQDTQAFACP